MPTDSGICHTFNGVALSKILKPSSWFSDFRYILSSKYTILEQYLPSDAFKLEDEEEHLEVFKSLGIDKEGGFVFSIDTMQVFFRY